MMPIAARDGMVLFEVFGGFRPRREGIRSNHFWRGNGYANNNSLWGRDLPLGPRASGLTVSGAGTATQIGCYG